MFPIVLNYLHAKFHLSQFSTLSGKFINFRNYMSYLLVSKNYKKTYIFFNIFIILS